MQSLPIILSSTTEEGPITQPVPIVTFFRICVFGYTVVPRPILAKGEIKIPSNDAKITPDSIKPIMERTLTVFTKSKKSSKFLTAESSLSAIIPSLYKSTTDSKQIVKSAERPRSASFFSMDSADSIAHTSKSVYSIIVPH